MPSPPPGEIPDLDCSLLESVPDAIVIARRDGCIAYVNPIACRLFGWRRGELLGRPLEELLPAPPPGLPAAGDLDLVGRRRDGTAFPAELRLSPLEAGGERYTIAAVRDVAGRRRTEGSGGPHRRAQEEVRERDEFLCVASHELRTPLAALQLQVQLLQRATRPGTAAPVGVPARLDVLERQCRRMAALVNDLLDVSRLRRGRLELQLEEVDLGDVVRDATARLAPEAARAGSALRVTAARGVSGRWDRRRLAQLVTQVVSNAIKFGRARPIEVTVTETPDLARVEVRDEGIGISPADQARIFDRFERAVPSDHFGGLGLGLYVAQAIVAAHGGTIAVRSAPGAGTTLAFDLPRAPPPA